MDDHTQITLRDAVKCQESNRYFSRSYELKANNGHLLTLGNESRCIHESPQILMVNLAILKLSWEVLCGIWQHQGNIIMEGVVWDMATSRQHYHGRCSLGYGNLKATLSCEV